MKKLQHLWERKTHAWPSIMPWTWQVLKRVSVPCAASRAPGHWGSRAGEGAKAILQGLWQAQWGGSPSLWRTGLQSGEGDVVFKGKAVWSDSSNGPEPCLACRTLSCSLFRFYYELLSVPSQSLAALTWRWDVGQKAPFVDASLFLWANF